MNPQPEVWLRGPVEGFEPLLMPAAHALLQAREDIEALAASVPAAHAWQRPGGAASIGFHVRHVGGVLDRLLTYARGEVLSDAQRAAARAEGEPAQPGQALHDAARAPARPSSARWTSCGPRRPTTCWLRGRWGGPACRARRWA